MPFKNVNDVNGPSIREYRHGLNLTIRQFWEPIGCSVARGHAYETGKTGIPEDVRKLVYLHYALGVPLDFESKDFARYFSALADRKTLDMNRARCAAEKSIALLKDGFNLN